MSDGQLLLWLMLLRCLCQPWLLRVLIFIWRSSSCHIAAACGSVCAHALLVLCQIIDAQRVHVRRGLAVPLLLLQLLRRVVGDSVSLLCVEWVHWLL